MGVAYVYFVKSSRDYFVKLSRLDIEQFFNHDVSPESGTESSGTTDDNREKDKEETEKDIEETEKDKEETEKDNEETGKDNEETGKDKEETKKDKEETDKDGNSCSAVTPSSNSLSWFMVPLSHAHCIEQIMRFCNNGSNCATWTSIETEWSCEGYECSSFLLNVSIEGTAPDNRLPLINCTDGDTIEIGVGDSFVVCDVAITRKLSENLLCS